MTHQAPLSSLPVRVLVLTLIALAVWGAAAYVSAPYSRDHYPDAEVFMEDLGMDLAVTQTLLEGRCLYRDIGWFYGPIPILMYEMTTRLVGNSPETFEAFQRFFFVVAMVSAFFTLRKYASGGILLATFLLLFGSLSLLPPEHITTLYYYIEIIWVLLLIREWRPIEERTATRCLFYGLIFSLLQFSKFGSHMVVGAAFVTIDLLQLAARGWKRELLISAIKTNLIILAGYTGFILVGAMLLLHFMSWRMVCDVLWPAFLKGVYANISAADRYPRWEGIRFFFEYQLPGLMGLAAGGGAIARLFIRRPLTGNVKGAGEEPPAFPYALLLLPLYYLFAMILLFHHEWHFYQYSIYPILGLAPICGVFGKSAQRLLLVLLIPCSLAWVLTLAKRHDPEMQALATPSGYTLSAPAATVRFYQTYFTILQKKETSQNKSVAILTFKPGVYFFGHLDVAGRYTWYLPNMVRPWETQSLTRNLLGACAVAVSFHGNGTTPGIEPTEEALQKALTILLPIEISDVLAKKLTNPVFVGIEPISGDQVWVYSVSA